MTSTTTHRFVPAGVDWTTLFQWKAYEALITKSDGSVVYRQPGVLFPEGWDQNSVNIVAQKYFRGSLAKGERECSLIQMIDRVVDRVAKWAEQDGLLPTLQLTRTEFYAELAYLVASQRFAFNSPVWFNVGWEEKPQCSACFILGVEDSIDSIAENAMIEMKIFKHGSGCGSNRSALRSSHEPVKGGGRASGPVSFIRIYDAVGGAIKSGGTVRRAAKMEILDGDHLDIEEFVSFKRNEERKARLLIDAGVDGSFCGEAYSTVSGQNANYSARVNDLFMLAVDRHDLWTLRGRHDPSVKRTIAAANLMRLIAECAWECADPGLQFDDQIQKFNTCANRARINATNPCSEYVFLDNTSCNLGSHNLLSYLSEDGTFDVAAFKRAVQISTIAMDALIDHAGYPTEKIGTETRKYRTLGIGYTGLGALLMCMGVPYDSNFGRTICSVITALMSGVAYETSAQMAARVGAFADYDHNQSSCADVMAEHDAQLLDVATAMDAADKWPWLNVAYLSAAEAWEAVVEATQPDQPGLRNAQTTVLAPTGTISFIMGVQASTGIEPVLGLVTFKNLAGGGVLKQVNPWIPRALRQLGLSAEQSDARIARLTQTGSLTAVLDSFPDNCREVFVTSFANPVTGEALGWKAHVDMMAAAQPFISGAISKTVNLPETATVEQIEQVYRYAWEKKLKCVAVYRDNSKGVQAIGTSLKEKATIREVKEVLAAVKGPLWGERSKLPITRLSLTTKFEIGADGHVMRGFLTVGMRDDGEPAEIFMTFNNVGGTVQGFTHSWCKAVSHCLQLGMPLEELAQQYLHTRFEPSGATRNPDIPACLSVPDYVMKFLLMQYRPEAYAQLSSPRPIKGVTRLKLPTTEVAKVGTPVVVAPPMTTPAKTSRLGDESCPKCGGLLQQAGACKSCSACGYSGGCG